MFGAIGMMNREVGEGHQQIAEELEEVEDIFGRNASESSSSSSSGEGSSDEGSGSGSGEEGESGEGEALELDGRGSFPGENGDTASNSTPEDQRAMNGGEQAPWGARGPGLDAAASMDASARNGGKVARVVPLAQSRDPFEDKARWMDGLNAIDEDEDHPLWAKGGFNESVDYDGAPDPSYVNKTTWQQITEDILFEKKRETPWDRLTKSYKFVRKLALWAKNVSIRVPIIHPNARARRAWDFLILFLVVYNAVMVPYEASFQVGESTFITFFEYSVDAVFFFDILLNFRTAFVDNQGTLINDQRAVAGHYLSTWFSVDLLASIPFELFAQIIGLNVSSNVTLLAFLKTPRLLRLGRLLRFFERMRNANIFKIFKLMMIMCMFAHWIGCGLHLIGKTQFDDGKPSWIEDQLRPEEQNDKLSRYLQAYYLSFELLVGDNVGPTNNLERFYCSLVLLVGACFYASVVGNMALLVSNLNATAARHKHKQELVSDVIRYLGLPADINDRVQEYFDYLTTYAHPGPDGINFLMELPWSLYEDIAMHLHGHRVRQVTLFASCEDAFITHLVTKLKNAVYMPSEIVFRSGDVGHEMYMIYKGRVAVINSHGETVAVLKQGGYFGELALLATARRTANCTTLTHCDLAVLRAHDLAITMKDFPEAAMMVREAALRRLAEIQVAGNLDQSTFAARLGPAHVKRLNELGGKGEARMSRRESDRGEKDRLKSRDVRRTGSNAKMDAPGGLELAEAPSLGAALKGGLAKGPSMRKHMMGGASRVGSRRTGLLTGAPAGGGSDATVVKHLTGIEESMKQMVTQIMSLSASQAALQKQVQGMQRRAEVSDAFAMGEGILSTAYDGPPRQSRPSAQALQGARSVRRTTGDTNA
ncbi:unnamed protein product [Pedinophyceae sp. YPF-701]|nr:unnamed protein product [Pedinophyceae sp. YPF-701]